MRRVTRLTDDGPLAENAALGPGLCQIEELRFHLSAAAAIPGEMFTVTVVSATGAAYNTVLLSQDMNGVQDLHWQPTRPIHVLPGDQLALAFLNGAAEQYGLEIIWSGLGV